MIRVLDSNKETVWHLCNIHGHGFISIHFLLQMEPDNSALEDGGPMKSTTIKAFHSADSGFDDLPSNYPTTNRCKYVNPFMPWDLLDKCRLDLSYFWKYLWNEAEILKTFEGM